MDFYHLGTYQVTRQILNLYDCRITFNNRWQYLANGLIGRFCVLADDTFCLTFLATDLITLIMSREAEINYSLNLPKKSFIYPMYIVSRSFTLG